MADNANKTDRKEIEAIVREAAASTESVDAEIRVVQAEAERRTLEHGVEIHGASAASLKVTKYASPLPPPELLEAYEKQAPGLREKLVNDWSDEQAHRRHMERAKLDKGYDLDKERLSNERIRMLYAFVLGLLAILVLGGVAVVGGAKAAAVVALVEVLTAWFLRKRLPSMGSRPSETPP